MVLPKLFRRAAVSIELQHGIVENKHRLLELLTQLVLFGTSLKTFGNHVGRQEILALVVVVTRGDEFQMENLVLIVVSLRALTCQLFECLAVLVHRVHCLWVVEHEGTCACHAKFNTLHRSKNLNDE